MNDAKVIGIFVTSYLKSLLIHTPASGEKLWEIQPISWAAEHQS